MGTRWSDEFMFGDRAYFDLSGPAALVVEDIRPAEAGVYRCRVDFKSAPTRNTLVNVTLLGINLMFFFTFVSSVRCPHCHSPLEVQKPPYKSCQFCLQSIPLS